MITEDTVLVLGAGASWPYGLPTASELKEYILRYLNEYNLKDGTHRAVDALIRFGYVPLELEKFREDFFISQQASIDAFLENQPDYLELGVRVIAAFLIPREKLESLHEDVRGPEASRSDDWHWYQYLFQRMGRRKSSLWKVRVGLQL